MSEHSDLFTESEVKMHFRFGMKKEILGVLLISLRNSDQQFASLTYFPKRSLIPL